VPDKEAERQVFDLVYGERKNLHVTPSERPDFSVEHEDGNCFGVEVTEFFFSESRARLEQIDGYAKELLAGKDVRHKADRRELNVKRVTYQRKDGSVRISGIPAIVQRNPSPDAFMRTFADLVNRKAAGLFPSDTNLSHINLIIKDRTHCLDTIKVEDFVAMYFRLAPELRTAVSRSPFREVFLVSNLEGTSGIMPLKMLHVMSEVFLFSAFVGESNSMKSAPEDIDGLEIFASYIQGNLAGSVFVSKNGDGTEVIYGNTGIGIVAGLGLVARDYADARVPENAVAADPTLAMSLDRNIYEKVEIIRQNFEFCAKIWLPLPETRR